MLWNGEKWQKVVESEEDIQLAVYSYPGKIVTNTVQRWAETAKVVDLSVDSRVLDAPHPGPTYFTYVSSKTNRAAVV